MGKIQKFENTFELISVFPNPNKPEAIGDGFSTSQEFKEYCVDKFANGDQTLIARQSNTILKDYEGDNLIKSFPLLFPYGIGSTTMEGEERGGEKYYRYLSMLSSHHFQESAVCAVLYNIKQKKNG